MVAGRNNEYPPVDSPVHLTRSSNFDQKRESGLDDPNKHSEAHREMHVTVLESLVSPAFVFECSGDLP